MTQVACNCFTPVVCTCPELSVTGPTEVTQSGSTMTFTANATGGSQQSVTYNWTVSQGEIVSGQGTPVITVQTTPAMAGQNVTATVTIGGDLCPTCVTTAQTTAGIASIPVATPFTEFTAATPDEIKANLDPFFSGLSNDPTAQGYIINYGTDAQIARRERDIRAAIRFRQFDASRVTFLRGGDTGTGIRTVLYIVPAGTPAPTPDQ